MDEKRTIFTSNLTPNIGITNCARLKMHFSVILFTVKYN